MLINHCWKKCRSFCSFKLLVLLVVIVWILNLILFYHLKSLSYRQNTVHVLQKKQLFLEEEESKITENVKEVGPTSCKKGNFSIKISNEILLLKDGLARFYHVQDSLSNISEKCVKFIREFQSSFRNVHRETRYQHADELSFQSGELISLLKTGKIIKIGNAPKGTQLKLIAHLENGVNALIKPKWYSPFDIISGEVYAGRDRHYGEIMAYYLSILLDMPRVPPAVSRKFDLHEEIILLADEKLLNTFLTKDNQTCFYGVCPYCNPSNLLCLDSSKLEGAVIFYLSYKLKLRILRHPWRRTYRCNSLARWEVEEHYCTTVRSSKFYSNKKNEELFFDLIDISIFDFLISNGDRHHYEFIDSKRNPRILILDNGKSFGNPHIDHVDILAPLYHCCVLRNSTWTNLLKLRGGSLSKWLKYLLKNSEDIIVNEMHFKALDRRLITVFSTVEHCFSKKGFKNVIVHD